MQTLPAGVEDLGRLAAECEFWAAQREMSVRDRHDLHKRAQAYRDEQFRLLDITTPYPHANVLEEGPNTSELPDEDTGNALIGAAWGFIFLIGLLTVATVVMMFWRTHAY
jgi:hypothetical protein